jgi:hypothetical protein
MRKTKNSTIFDLSEVDRDRAIGVFASPFPVAKRSGKGLSLRELSLDRMAFVDFATQFAADVENPQPPAWFRTRISLL